MKPTVSREWRFEQWKGGYVNMTDEPHGLRAVVADFGKGWIWEIVDMRSRPQSHASDVFTIAEGASSRRSGAMWDASKELERLERGLSSGAIRIVDRSAGKMGPSGYRIQEQTTLF